MTFETGIRSLIYWLSLTLNVLFPFHEQFKETIREVNKEEVEVFLL